MNKQNNRVQMIDSMRGFSLVGILLANMLIFQYGMWGKDALGHFSTTHADSFAHIVLNIFVEGSFMPIFAFLFGYSMIKMKQSLENKGLKPKGFLSRRFGLLIIAGILHSKFLWEGDILFAYGMMGFFLMLFMNRNPKTLLIWGIVLLSLFGLFGFLPNEINPNHFLENYPQIGKYISDSTVVYGTGTYEQIQHFRETVSPLDSIMPSNTIVIFYILLPVLMAPMFLFGMYAARKQWFQNPLNDQRVYRNRMILFLSTGLLLKSLKYILPDMPWSSAGEFAGPILLSLGYIFAYAYVYTKACSSAWYSYFEAVGKLSMTNYLLQTMICTTIFYGYGLGLFGKLGVIAGCLLSLIIYSVQLYGSRLYLNHFKIGPFEYLLRMGTYFSFKRKMKQKKVDTVTTG